MNETTKKAIETYEKLHAETVKAYQNERKADQATAAAWEAYDRATENKTFLEKIKEKKENELYNKFIEADAKQKKAHEARRIAEAAENAAGINAARAAAEELKAAIIATPEKFDFPANGKRFQNAVKKVFETDQFYTVNDFYTVNVTFYPYYTRYEAHLLCLDTVGGNIKAEKANAGTYYIATYNEIKKEARQAAKDTKKIEELQKEAARKAEEIKAKYNTDIKNYLPLLHTLPIEGARFYN